MKTLALFLIKTAKTLQKNQLKKDHYQFHWVECIMQWQRRFIGYKVFNDKDKAFDIAWGTLFKVTFIFF